MAAVRTTGKQAFCGGPCPLQTGQRLADSSIWLHPTDIRAICVALRDPKVLIRESALDAVSECFEIIAARDSQVRKLWFAQIYEEALLELKSSNVDWIHGSLLVLKELLLKGAMFMNEHY